ncbi:MAG: fibronectin type III domain-containing protein [Taibaiella sp.]|nr:fibronectin type III domain-containing protein [Taibaiella sp.]
MKRFLAVLFLTAIGAVSAMSQTISSTKYPLTTTTGVSLENMSSGTTSLVGSGSDDGTSGVKTIGFDFWYVGTRYTQFSVNANGLVRLGASAATSSWTNSFTETTNNPKIMPYWDDIATGTNGGVRYKVIGSAPNRKLVIDWYNMTIPRSVGSTGAGNFQCWLNESTGVIEFVYGSGVVTNTSNSGASIGLATGTTVYASINASTDAVTYGTGALNTNTVAISSGKKYAFTPIIPAAPTAVTFGTVTNTSMFVNWTPASPTTNIYGYVLYRSTDGGATYTYVGSYTGASTSTAGNQTGLTTGVTYTWKVMAYTEGGLSSPAVGSQVASSTTCSGTPTAGTVTASTTSACADFTSNLGLSGTTSDAGIQYQWQSSPDNATWSNVTGATNSTYSASVTATVYYRANITCSVSSLSAATSGQLLARNSNPAAITGTASICPGATATLSCATSGGTWSSSNTAVGTVNSSTGVVGGVSSGTTTISYIITATGCYAVTTATINAGPSTVSITPSSSATICQGETAGFTASSTAGTVVLLDQNWNSGMTGAIGGTWTITNTSGVSTSYFQLRTSPGYNSVVAGDGSQYIEAAPDATTSTTSTLFTSPAFSLSGYASATLTLNQYYLSYSADATVAIEYSTNGGSTWSTLQSFLGTTTGSTTWTTSTPTTTISLASLVGQSSVMLRWNYISTWGFYWAVDNIKVVGTPNVSYAWTGVSGATGLSCSTCANPTIATTVTGTNIYSVSATASGCANGTTVTVNVNPSPTALAGTLSACAGATSVLISTPGGGAWSTSSGTASVTGGTVTAGGSAGTTIVSYTVAGCSATAEFTVNANPGSTSGTLTVCSGQTTALSNPGGFGTWTSSNTGVATVGSNSGVVTGVAAGTAAISYANGCGSPVGVVVTVSQTPGAITGSTIVCEGSTTTLGNANGGGTWTSSSTSNATVGASTGVVTGVSAGTTIISYDLGNGCPAATRTQTVNIAPPAISISPSTATTICLTANSAFTASTVPTVAIVDQDWNSGMTGATGGTWTITNTAGTSTSYFQIRTSPGYTGFVTGDGSAYMEAAPDATTGLTSTIFTSPVFSLAGYASASLTLNQYYQSYSADATVAVEYSTDGGSTWATLSSILGSSITASSSWTAASPTSTISLAALVGQSNVRLRWNYISTWGYYWIIDNIKVVATYATPTFAWSGISGATGLSCSACAATTITPTALGDNVYSVSATANGCSSTNGVTVTTEEAGLVTVTGGGTACGSATLAASGGSGGTIYYQGTTSNGTSIATPSSSEVVTSSGTYYFRARTATAMCWGTQGSATVTINTVPTAAPTNDGPICNGGTVNLDAHGANGASVYSWSGPGLSASTGATPTATPTVTTVYSVTVSDGSGNPGCSPSTVYTTQVTVNSTPTASPSNSGPICNGGTVTLTANPAGGATTFTWSGPGLSSTSVANPTATPTATTTYSLTVGNGTSASGCNPSTVYTTTVTVRPTPGAAPTNDGHICIGGTVNLAANPVNSASVFTWSGASLGATTGATPTATPTSTSVYSLTVSDGTGQSGCSPSTVYTTSVTVNAVPTAAPTNSGPICNGGTVTLTGNGANGASAYNWSGSNLVATTGSPTTATPASTAVYSLTVTDGSGHSGCSPSTVYTTSVTVNPTPTAAPTNNGPMCNGGTVTLTANPSGGASVYNWSGSNLSSSTLANPTATPTTTTTYSLTVSDGSGFSGCSPSTVYTTQVTVRPTPSAAPTNNGHVCLGGTVTLAANPANAASVFTWSGPVLSATTAQNPTAVPTTTSTYSLVVSDGTGQSGCSPSTVYTTSVTVNSVPTAAPTNSGPICNGGTVTLTANGANGAATYSWSGPGLVASTGAVTTATPTVTSVYSLTVTDGSGKPGCSPATVYTTSVTVNSTPIASPSNNGHICVGGTVNLAANPSGGATVFNWSGPSLSSSTVANPTATPTVTSVYSLTVSDGSGLSGCSPSTVYTTSVTVNNAPTASPSNNGYICNGGTVALTANGANGASTYAWSGSSLSATTGSSTTATPTSTSVYSLTVTDGSGHSGCSPSTVYTTSVTVNPKPTAAPTNSSPICNGGTVTLTANPAGGASTYAWSGPSLSSSTAANPTATPTVTVSYSLTVTDGSSQPGCTPSTVYTTTVSVNPTPAAAPTNNGYICNGGTVTLSANPSGGATVFTWSGSSLASTTAQNPTATPTSTNVYSLTVSDGTGNSGCSPATIYTTSVTVNSAPTAAPTNTGIICVGGTVTLNANPANGANTYTWSGSSLSASTAQNPTATPTVTSVYSLTVSDGSGKPGCSPATVYTTSASVKNAPSVTSASNNGPACEGATLTLTANSPADVTDYAWTGPVSITGAATASASVPGATTAATGVYTLTINNGTESGCTKVYTTSATVNTIPTVASITPSSTLLCSGATLGLNAGSVSGSGSLVSYNWSGPNGFSTTTSGTSTNLTVSTASSGIYTLSVTYTGVGCNSNPVTSSDVTVNALPTMVSLGATPTVLCAGASLSLSGNGATGTGSLVSYNWSGPGGYSSTTATSTQVYATPNSGASGVYSVTATYPGTGCTSTPVVSTAVTVNPIPVQFNITGGGFYCSGGTGVSMGLDNSEVGVNYQLYQGSSAVGSPLAGTGAALDFGMQTAAGTYSVGATNATTSCTNSMLGTTTVTIGAVPIAYNVTGGGSFCAGGTGVSVGISNSQSSVSYQLRRDGVDVGSLVTGTGAAFSFGLVTDPGVYTVMANPSATCAQAMTGSATVYVNPLPSAYTVSGGGTYCAGGTGFHITQDFSITGINYQLYNGASTVGSPAPGSNSGIDYGLQTAAGTYSVLATNATTGCTNVMSGMPTITVNSLPTVYTVTGGGNFCAGGAGVGIGLSNSSTGINYQVYNGSSAVGSPVAGTGSALSLGTFTAAGTYTVRATNTSTSCSAGMSGSAAVVVNALPAAYSVTGGGNYCTGGSGVHVGLGSSETGVNYQLYNGSTAVGSPVSGSGAGLDFGLITSAGTYTVRGTNFTTGCVNNMSGSATVGTNPLPTAQTVTGGGTICGGSSTPVGLNGSQTGVNYQLYNGSSVVGSAVAGTGSALSFGSMTAAGTYTVRATNTSTSCINGMTGSAVISINAAPTAYTVTGGGAYCSGSSGSTVGLNGSESGVNYQLYNGGSAVGSVVSGTGSAISFGSYTAAGTYSVLATNTTTTCTNAMTGSVAISINSLPTAYTVTGGGGYCSDGSGVHVGLSNSNTGISYQLYNGGSAVGSPMAGTGYSLDFGYQTAAGTYTVLATNSSTACPNAMSGSATVTVNTAPSVYNVTGGGNYCSGTGGLPVGLDNSASGINYQLFRGSTPIGSPVAGTGSSISFGNQTTAGTYSVVATNGSTSCTSNMAGTAVIGIYSVPSAYAVTGGGNYCAGGSGMAVGLFSSQTGVNYQLYNDATAVGSVVAGTGSSLSFGTYTAAGTYTVLATDATNACTKPMTGNAVIGINPLPTAYNVSGGGAYCAGGTGVHVGMGFTNAGINYQLYRDGSAVGSPMAGTAASIDFGLQTVAGTYTVQATNATTSCVNDMTGSAVVVINPLPVTYSMTGGGNYCAGGSGVAVGLSGSETGISYQLYNGSTLIGSATTSGTGSAISFGTFTAAGTYSVFATNTTTTCTQNMSGTSTVVIDPLPTVYSVTGGGTLCVGQTGYHVGLANSQSGVNYQLYNGSATVGSAVAGTGSAIDFGVFTVAGTYTVHAVNASTGCQNNMSGNAIVVVNPLPAVQTMTGGGAYCAGGSGVAIGLASSVTGIDYQLYRGTTPYGTALAGTGSAVSYGMITDAGTYTVLATNATTGCHENMSGAKTIVINPLPTVYTVSGGGSYCSGGAGVNAYLSGSQFGVFYQLYLGSSTYGTLLSGAGIAIDFGALATAGTYTVRATNGSTGCVSDMSGAAYISINPLPNSYTVTGGGSFCAGTGGVNVSLSGSQTGINYVLYSGTTAAGSAVSGTGGGISFGSISTGGTYTVLATNTSTSCTKAMTGSATVTVLSLPTVYTVEGGGTYCAGGAGVNVGLSASNTGINYQLYNGSSVMGSPLSGTGMTLSYGMQTVTGTYTVRATDMFTGCVSNMAGSATVGMNALPVAQSMTGGGAYCSGGTGVAVGLASSESGITYQLYRGATAVGSALSGTGSALNFGLMTVAGSYSVRGTNTTTGCSNDMAGSVAVVVNPLPAAFNVTGGGSYCNGGTGVSIGLSGSATGISYQAYLGSVAMGSAATGTGSAIGFGSMTAAGAYTVRATDIATGCSGNMTGSATVVVNPLPTVYTVTGGGSYCTGGTGVAVGLSGSTIGVSYALYNGGTLAATAAGTGTSMSFGNQVAAGSYTVRATNSATGCVNNMAGGASVGINPLPVAQIVSGGGNYCSGGIGVNVTLANSESGVNYQLYRGGTSIGSAVAGTGSAMTFGLQTTAGSYSVSAMNSSTGCMNNMIGSAVVVVNPLPTAYTVTGGGNVCSGTSGTAIGLSGSEVGVSYRLYFGTSVSGSVVAGTGSAISFGNRTAAGTYTVLATNTLTSCTSGMTGSASISVNASPFVYNVTGGGTYCEGGSGFAVSLSGSQVGVSYQLYNGTDATGAPVSGSGSAISFGTQTASGTYSVFATNAITSCTSNMSGAVSVNVNPRPAAFAVTGGGAYCSGGAGVAVGLAGSQTGISYQLYYNGTATGSSIAGTGATLSFGMKMAAGSYSVAATNISTGCAANMTGSAVVIVNPLPNAQTVMGGGAYCAGGSGVFITLSGSQTGVSYQLYRGTVAASSAMNGTGGALSFGLQTIAGSYSVLATQVGTGCTQAMTGSAIVSVNALPVAYNVTGGGNYCAGGTGVAVGLSNSSAGVAYQLYSGGSPVGSSVVGTGSAISFGLKTAAGNYMVTATDGSTGCTNDMSGIATVGINAVPVVYSVMGGGSYCAGGSGVHVTLSGSSTSSTYQLYNGSSVAGAAIAGTGAELDFGAITTAGTYSVRATNVANTCSRGMNETADVTINPLPSAFSVTGGGSYCNGGSGVAIGLSGSQFGVNYTLNLGSTPTGTTVAGTGGALNFGIIAASGSYNVLAVNSATGCSRSMTGAANVTINSAPQVYDLAGGGSFCAGGTSDAITLSGSQTGVSYRLYNGASAVGAPVSGTGLALSFGTTTATGTYSVLATNTSTSCAVAMNGNVSVVSNALPLAYTISGGGSYCSGGAGVAVGLSGSQAGVTYQLFAGTTAVGSAVAGTGGTISFGNQTGAGNYTVVAENATTHCVRNMTGTVTVAVAPSPVTYNVTGGGTYCQGAGGVHVGISGSQTGATYRLYNGATAVGTVMTGTGASLDFGIVSASGTYTVLATNTTMGCTAAMTGSANVVVNPLPAVQSVTGGGSFCEGSATGVSVSLDGSESGIVYTLYNGTSVSGTAIAGTGGAVSFGPQSVAGTYSVSAANATTGCTSDMSGAVAISVNALPVAYNVSGSASSYCAGGAGVVIAIDGSQSGASYQLYNGATAVGTAVVGTGAAMSFGSQLAAGMYSVVATSAQGCTRAMTGVAPVAINQLPAAYLVTGGGTMCPGGVGPVVGLSSSETGVAYKLYRGAAEVATVSGTGTAITFGAQPNNGTYTVMAVNSGTGCSRAMPGSASVSTNPAPTVYTVAGGGSFCEGATGQHVGLSNSSTSARYQLYRDGSAVGLPVTGTGSAIDFGVFVTPGLYTVSAITPVTGCTNNMAGSATISVNTLPELQSVTGGGGYCPGTSGVAVDVSGSALGTTYRLYKGSAMVATMPGTGGPLSFGSQTAGTYTVSAISTSTGCVRNMSGSVVASVNPVPAPQVVTGGGAYCEGGSGTAVGLVATESGVQYRLYMGAAAMGAPVTGTGASLSFGSQTSAGTYTVMATNALSCSVAMTGSATVSITPTVAPAVTMTMSATTVCAGNSVMYMATPVNGGSAPAYQWKVNGTAMGTGATYTYVPANSDLVEVVMTSNAACPLPATATASTVMTVAPTYTPVVNVEASHTGAICKGASLTYTATPEYGGTAPVYSWMRNGSLAGVGASYTVAPENGDVVYCMMTSNYTCRSASTVVSAYDTLEVVEPTLPTVLVTTDAGVNIAPGQYVKFSATLINAGPTPEISWSINGIDVDNATGTEFITNLLKNHDTVACKVLSSGPCGGVYSYGSLVIDITGVGVANAPVREMDIRVIPNPSNGTFSVKGLLGTDVNGLVDMNVTNMLGQVVYKTTVKSQRGSIDEQVMLDNSLSNGIYLLNIVSGDSNKVIPVTISR